MILLNVKDELSVSVSILFYELILVCQILIVFLHLIVVTNGSQPSSTGLLNVNSILDSSIEL